jgi:hypothetical protein
MVFVERCIRAITSSVHYLENARAVINHDLGAIGII